MKKVIFLFACLVALFAFSDNVYAQACPEVTVDSRILLDEPSDNGPIDISQVNVYFNCQGGSSKYIEVTINGVTQGHTVTGSGSISAGFIATTDLSVTVRTFRTPNGKGPVCEVFRQYHRLPS